MGTQFGPPGTNSYNATITNRKSTIKKQMVTKTILQSNSKRAMHDNDNEPDDSNNATNEIRR